MLAVIHMIGLKWAESRPVADGLSLEGYWMKYLVRLIWAAALGTVLASFRSAYRKSPKLQTPVTWIAVAVILFLLYCIDCYDVSWYLRSVMGAAWPVLVYPLAKGILGRVDMENKKRVLCAEIVYYLVITALIWLVDDKLLMWEHYRREPLRMIYLIVTAAAALWLAKREYKRVNVLLPAIVLFALFRQQPRVGEILESLSNPFSSVSGSRWEVNWLGYRLQLCKQGWSGDFSLMGDHAAYISADCPLVWLNASFGFLAFALCVRTVLALAANVFLITTSDVGILMMGNAYDIIPLMFFLTAGAETGTRGEKVTAR